MFIFIDESGSTNRKAGQRYLVVAFALMNTRQFAEEIIIQIRDKCKEQGQPVKIRELKYHNLTPFQREIAVKIINSNYRNFYVCFLMWIRQVARW